MPLQISNPLLVHELARSEPHARRRRQVGLLLLPLRLVISQEVLIHRQVVELYVAVDCLRQEVLLLARRGGVPVPNGGLEFSCAVGGRL